MWRKVMDSLDAWKDDPRRKPLLIRGVRQCGKTTILKQFGESRFRNCVYINLEKQPRFRSVFDQDLTASRIISDLSALGGNRITPGDTLLILDEIQSCPQALASLKYFREEAPEYHVACAGSLLGVELAKPSSQPVGMTDDITMHPMDFHEWLVANGEGMLWDAAVEDPSSMSDAYAYRFERLYREYLFVGGMPEAVDAWVATHDEDAVIKAQDGILNWYAADMLSHAPASDADKIFQVWRSLPVQLTTETGNFMFSHVRKGGRARELEGALQWLVDAGHVHKVHLVETPKVPMAKQMDMTTFKVFICDVGLMGRMMDLTLEAFVDRTDSLLSDDYRGALAESFVLNELICTFGDGICYWKDSRQEVDFLIQHRSRIFPLEVKSGRKMKAGSLGTYIDRYGPLASVLLSLNLPKKTNVIHLPLYMAGAAREVLDAEIDASLADRPGVDQLPDDGVPDEGVQ